jgi:tight adherence protein B
MVPNLTLVLTFLLAAICVGGLLFAILQPYLASSDRIGRRSRMVLRDRATSGAAHGSAHGHAEGKPRRRSVEDTLRDIEDKQKAMARSRSRKSLQSRLREAGLAWSRHAFWGICAATGCLLFATLWLGGGLGAPYALALAVPGGLYLPRAYVRFRRNRRLRDFAALFPDAVDVIVRGVRSGMPLGDCLRVLAVEGQDPVRSEFRTVVADQTMGVPVHEAVQRLADRVALPETNFLAIVITIQSRAGGNLTEALSNLSTVLRERKKMRAKIRAMSAEAKASGGIIGALPPIVASVLFLTSPDYVSLLFSTLAGNIVLVASACWMLIGVLVMRKMINFDF